MSKKFVIFWDPQAYAPGEFGKEVGIDFFTEDNGFFEEDIKAINNLDIGEMYTCMSIIDAVRVIRLKE